MTSDAEIVVGVRGDISGGRTIERTLDNIATKGDKATGAVDNFDKKTKSTSETVKGFGRALKGLAAAFAIREIGQMADAFTNIQNRLKVVTTSTEQFNQALTDVQRVAANSLASLEGTANTYSRVAIATKGLNLSQKELADTVQAINQTFRISGSTAQETAAASVQLAQGLASGALRGDELRSVLENNIVLGNLLADTFNTDVGTLRDLAAEGAITADVIVNTLLKSFDDLETQAAQMQPTLGQAFTQLTNGVTTFIGQSEVLNGVTGAISQSMIYLGQNIDTVATVVGVAITAFTAYIAVTKGAAIATTVASGAVAAFNAVILANPLGLFIAAIAAVGVAAYAFRDDIYDAMIKPVAALIVAMDAAIAKIKNFYNEVKGGFDTAVASILVFTGQIDAKDAGQVLKDRRESTPTATTKFDPNDISAAIGDLLGRDTGGKSKAGQLPGAIGGTTQAVEALNDALGETDEKIKQGKDSTSDLEKNIKDIRSEVDRFGNSAAQGFADFISGAKSAKDVLRGLVNDLLQLTSRKFITEPFGNILDSVPGGIGGGSSGGGGGFLSGIGSAIGSVFGFDSGGQMVLGGKSGIDQNILSLNGSPIAKTGRGETLSISPSTSGGGGGGIVVNQIINLSMGVQETVRAEVSALLPQIKQTTIAGVREADYRGIS